MHALILVVEDDPGISELIAEILEEESYQIATAANGKRALTLVEILEPRRPALIILDMMMPTLDGFGFLRDYAAWPAPRPPVLAISGSDTHLNAAIKAGASSVLLKPFSPDQLIESVKELLAGLSIPHTFYVQQSPDQEIRRLRTVSELHLDEPIDDAVIADFLARTSRAFNASICVISTLTETRQFYSAGWGIPEELQSERGAPKEQSFCEHAAASRGALVVQNALESPLFRDNPLVQKLGLRFYAGFPLVLSNGEIPSMLCVMDYSPHEFSFFDAELLRVLGRCVARVIEARRITRVSCAPWFDLASGMFGRDGFLDVFEAELFRCIHSREELAVVGLSLPEEDLAPLGEAFRKTIDRGWIGRLSNQHAAMAVPGCAPHEAKLRIAGLVPSHPRVVALGTKQYIGAADLILRSLEVSLSP